MIPLGDVPVRSGVDVGIARRKVFDLVGALSDNIRATRVATGVSEICRALVRQGAASIGLALDARGATVDLVLRVAPAPPGRVALGFFDEQRVTGGTLVARASLGPIDVPEGRVLDRLRGAVQRRSRETLLSDLTRKNQELQQSLDDLRRTRSAKERMESELSIGRDIQMAMLPLEFPAFPHRGEFDVHAVLRPAREVGGDFYDFFLLDQHTLAVCVGDVSGKGVPAALFMAVTKTLLKSRASHEASPSGILSHANDELADGNDSAMFVTLFLAVVDLRTGQVRYCNAGHNPPYVLRADGTLDKLDERHGPVVGAMEELTYGESTMTLRPGDVLLLFTDGVTEAMNVARELYGEARLEEALRGWFDLEPHLLTHAVADAVRTFEGEADQADDVTVLAVRYAG